MNAKLAALESDIMHLPVILLEHHKSRGKSIHTVHLSGCVKPVMLQRQVSMCQQLACKSN